MADDIVIKISGDIKNFSDALDKARSQTEELENGLSKIAKISGVAFAALTAEIGISVAAFGESQKASRELSTALQNQGIYSKALEDQYKAQAAALQKLTGVDDDAILSATASLQAMIGQKQISQELTAATLDLAAAKDMDLKSATDLIGKGINGQTMALKKLGIEIDEHLSKQQRTDEIIKQVTLKFGGQAEAANQGVGSIKGLTSAFSDFQEEIGSRFAPFIEFAIKKITAFFQYMSENKALMDFTVALITAGATVAGLATAVGVAGTAFLGLKAALLAAGVATNAMSLAVKGLVGATGIGLLVVLLAEIYLNWSTIWPRMQAIFQAFVNNLGALGGGLADILKGVFTLDVDRIRAGLEAAKKAFTQGFTDYQTITQQGLDKVAAIEAAHEQRQDAARKVAADKEAALQAQKEADKLARLKAEQELYLLQLQNGTQEMLALKKAEVDLLLKLEDEKYAKLREQMVAKLEENRAFQAEQDEIDKGYREEQYQAFLAKNEEYQAMSDEQKAKFRAQNDAALKSEIKTEDTTRQDAAKKKQADQIQANNTYLAEQQKYGTAYATINQVMHSEVFRGTKQAFGEMEQFQQSSNATLKRIGKAAAVANIIIKTAESAMNIYQGFSAIPIVGPALGIAGAAAAVVFGAEQVSKVTAAAQGGLLQGGVPGVDSIPVLAQHNELISPAQNFEEVIGSVRAKREAERVGGGFGGGGGGEVRIIMEMKDQLMDFIETKLVERSNIGISLQRAT